MVLKLFLYVSIGLLVVEKAPRNHNLILIDTNPDCKRISTYGNVKYCLPIFDGMEECYLDTFIKQYADAYEYEGNTIIGYYLPTEDYKQKDSGQIELSTYFKLYVVDRYKNTKVGTKELDIVANGIDKQSLRDISYKVKKKVELSDSTFSIGIPVLIESYSLNEDIRTFVMINKSKHLGIESVKISIANVLLLKDRLVNLAYYEDYTGNESITKAIANNDYIALTIHAVNQK